MSIHTDGVDDAFARTSSPITDYPYVWSVWFRTADVTQKFRAIVGHLDTTASPSNRYWILEINTILTLRQRNGTAAVADTVNTVSVDTWHHALAQGVSATDRKVWLDGDDTNKGTNTTSKTIAGTTDLTAIGALEYPGGWNDFFAGDVAEWAIWDTDILGATPNLDVVTALASGADPLLVSSTKPVGLYRLQDGRGFDHVQNAGDLSVQSGAPVRADDPPVFRKRRSGYWLAAAVAGGGRIMSSLAKDGGLAGMGGIAGKGGGLAA